MRDARALSLDLRCCPSCDRLQRVPDVLPRAVARCGRCAAVLRRGRGGDGIDAALAWALAGLILYAAAVTLPFMRLNLYGRELETTLPTGLLQLYAQGFPGLAAITLLTVTLLPLARLLALTAVLGAVKLDRTPYGFAVLYRVQALIGPWAMIDVFLLGLFVAYTRLIDLANVEIGAAAVALGGLMPAMAAMDHAHDPQTVWRRLRPLPDVGSAPPGRAIGCEACGQVSAVSGPGAPPCPRCGAALHARKPAGTERAAALLLAAAILYVPANLYPVLTLNSRGQGAPSTIFGGAIELLHAGMWPLAVLVFAASIAVPVFKLIALGSMLLAVRLRPTRHRRAMGALYRVVEQIGRWSMIDIFMLAVLVALVRFGAIASVEPGLGAVCFAAVVVLTMLAASAFDPRLIWDAAGGQRTLKASADAPSGTG